MIQNDLAEKERLKKQNKERDCWPTKAGKGVLYCNSARSLQTHGDSSHT